jgi:DNA-binding NarL/FixJ family response regulator
MSTIRLVLADDHTVFRAGLKLLLQAYEDIEVVGEAADTGELLEVVERLKPDVLVLDLTMPGGSSIPWIERLRRLAPATRIVILTMHDDPALVRAALAGGASGFVVKNAADTELVAAIRAVAKGSLFVDLDLPPDQLRILLGAGTESRSGDRKGPLDRLSKREAEVLLLLAQGHTNQQIAADLDLSVKTIETYRARIGDKLGLRSRADLIRFAVELGLIGPGKFGSDPT